MGARSQPVDGPEDRIMQNTEGVDPESVAVEFVASDKA